MNDIPLTIVGNLAGDPELRFTPSGAAVASFTVAQTPRKYDKQTTEWVDGETVWMRCSIWRQAAENVAECLTKGTRVIVTGRLVQRQWETKEGEKRSSMELQADDIGASVKFATARVQKAQRRDTAPPAEDPWANAPGASGGAGAGYTGDPNHYDEPPF